MRQAHNFLPLTSLDNFSRDIRNAALEENKKVRKDRKENRLEETDKFLEGYMKTEQISGFLLLILKNI